MSEAAEITPDLALVDAEEIEPTLFGVFDAALRPEDMSAEYNCLPPEKREQAMRQSFETAHKALEDEGRSLSSAVDEVAEMLRENFFNG